MTKKTVLLLAILLLCCASAHALVGTAYPAWDGQTAPVNALSGEIDGKAITLGFDGSPEFTTVADGMIETCFYTYDSDETNLIEIFVLLPQNIKAGSAPMELCSISMLEGNPNDERAYFAGSMAGQLWPQNTQIQLQLDLVEADAQQLHVSGRFSASLARIVNDQPTSELLTLTGVRFDFTLALTGAAASAQPAAPQYTLPPVYRVL